MSGLLDPCSERWVFLFDTIMISGLRALFKAE